MANNDPITDSKTQNVPIKEINPIVPPSQPVSIPQALPTAERSATQYGMWVAFEYILLFISLYVLSTALALAIHFYIDRWLPDIANDYYKIGSSLSSFQNMLLRGYLAAIIVAYPLFSLVFLHLIKRKKEDPGILELKSRKVLIYLTLVATFVFLLYNIIQIIYNFLGGNISFNFILHFLLTIGVSGSIFGYFLNEVKGDRKHA